MGFNRRKMEADRKARAGAEAAARRATHAQVPEDSERLIAVWNERQARRMPLMFSPTISAAIIATLRGLPHYSGHRPAHTRSHRDAAVTSLIPALSCRSCRPNTPFAELARLSRTSIADEMRIEHTRRLLGG
jgi:hypothetical protein